MNFLKKIIKDKIQQTLFALIITISIYVIPTQKYKILALFLFTIANFILLIFDAGTMTLLSMSIGLFSQILTTNIVLQSFSNLIIWQIMCFLFLSQALTQTGLAKKISIYIIYLFGGSPLKLSFGFCFLSVIFALILPTSTARMGGIFIPILASIFEILSKEDENLKQTIIKVIIYSNTIASAMFFTASSGNFYIQEIIKNVNVFITPQDWIINGLFPGIITLIFSTIFINYWMGTKTSNLKKINKKMKEEIMNLEPFRAQEIIILGIFISIFILFFFAPQLNIEILGILFLAICIIITLDLLKFEEDILNNKEAWTLFFWMSNLLMLSDLITKHQSFSFLQNFSAKALTFIPSHLVILFVLIFYGYSQYFFASSTVHASALYLICFELCVQYGYDKFLSALMLAYISNLFAGLTTYSASEVILITKTFNCDPKEFNKNGFIISSLIFVLWLICGSMWWKLTGVL